MTEVATFATLDDIKIGEKEHASRTVSEADVYLFCGILGNTGPIHIDEEYSKKTRYGTRLVPGVLVAGFGQGALHRLVERLHVRSALVSVYWKFVGPTRIGDTIKAEVSIAEKIPEKKRFKAAVNVTNQKGETVVVGEVIEQLI